MQSFARLDAKRHWKAIRQLNENLERTLLALIAVIGIANLLF